jgi:hypothetical protein
MVFTTSKKHSVAGLMLFFTLFGWLLFGSTSHTVSGAQCKLLVGTIKYGSTVGVASVTLFQASSFLALLPLFLFMLYAPAQEVAKHNHLFCKFIKTLYYG